jgi:hypothetical protein
MPGRRGTPADQLARDYGVSLNEFASSVIDVIVDTHSASKADRGIAHRREVCAAVTAAMVVALEASALSDEERTRLGPMIHDVLLPFWSKHCASDPDATAYIATRIEHYTARRIAGSHVKSAVNLVGALLEAMEIPADLRGRLNERLVPAFAHRLVGDTYRINDVRNRHGIDLPLLATLCGLLQMSLSYDSVLRMLRIG